MYNSKKNQFKGANFFNPVLINQISYKTAWILLFIACASWGSEAIAQKTELDLKQSDPRVTVRAFSKYSSISEMEEFTFTVRNNTYEKQNVVISVELRFRCYDIKSKDFILGVNDVITIEPGKVWESATNDYSYSVPLTRKHRESCARSNGNSWSVLNNISYNVHLR